MSGCSRVLIPGSLRKMIQDIKEIAGNHSDEDIYTMLKECNMDPNETAQKLLHLDTFHEVKKKRDRRKLNVSRRSTEEYRWRGARGGRGNLSTHFSDDAGGRRTVVGPKEVGVGNRMEGVSRPHIPVHKMERNTASDVSKSSTASMNSMASETNGITSDGLFPKLSAGMSPTPTDPVLMQSLDAPNHSAVGTLNCEVDSEEIATGSGDSQLPENSRLSSGQAVLGNGFVGTNILSPTNSKRPTMDKVEKNLHSDHRQASVLPKFDSSQAAISNHDSFRPQTNGSFEVAPESVVDKPNLQSHSKLNDPVFEGTTPKLEMMLEKLDISAHQSVIFPSHFKVSKSFKNELTFGSLNGIFEEDECCNKGLVHEAESVQNEAAAHLSTQSFSSTAHDGDYSDGPQSPPHMPKKLPTLQDNNASSDGDLKHDQPKQDIVSPLGGPHYPLLQTSPDYNFSVVPPLLGPRLIQFEAPGLQVGSSLVPSTSSSTPPLTHPVGVSQNLVPVSPQLLPFFRQPYPPNYIPYGPYFPHIYFPQNVHQFLGHSGFPRQLSAGNVYIPPAAAVSGVKFPVPPSFKPGANGGNLTHFGLPSGHGSYSSTPFGYNSAVALTSGSSGNNVDIAASELKEKNMYPTVQQNEESQAWTFVPGQDISSLQANYFCNFPQRQHVALSTAHAGHGAFAGIYNSTQAMANTSTVQSFLQQFQPMAGSIDSVAAPLGSYQQPAQQEQMNWNAKLLNRDNI